MLVRRTSNRSLEPDKLRENLSGIAIVAALEGAAKAVQDNSIITLQEARDSLTGQAIEAWADKLRGEEIRKLQATILIMETMIGMADIVETFARKTLPQTDRSSRHLFTYQAGFGPGVPFKVNGKYTFITGWKVWLRYRGKEPLTDVVFLSRLKTTGPSTALTVGQRRLLALDSLTGFDEKSPQIEKMFRLQNYYDRMPKTGCSFVAKLQPGDVVDLPLGAAANDFVVGGSVAMYSAQGQLPAHAFVLTPTMREGMKKLCEQIAIGTPKANIVKRLADLTPLALEDWPLPAKPDFSKLPTDTEYYRWPDEMPCPVLWGSARRRSSMWKSSNGRTFRRSASVSSSGCRRKS